MKRIYTNQTPRLSRNDTIKDNKRNIFRTFAVLETMYKK